LTYWNYRAIPHSEIKEKLSNCSERNCTKFHRYFLRECIEPPFRFTPAILYDHYRDFCDLYGVQKRSDRSYVVNNLELYLKMSKHNGEYHLTPQERDRYLDIIKG